MDPPAAQSSTPDSAKAAAQASTAHAAPPSTSASQTAITEHQTTTELSLDSLNLAHSSEQPSQLQSAPNGDDARFSAQEKGKGRLLGPVEAETVSSVEQQSIAPQPVAAEVVEVPLGEDPLAAEVAERSPALIINHPAPLPPKPEREEAPEEEWPLKSIPFPPLPPPPSSTNGGMEPAGHRIKIICQNLNGPCSFIALCNVLLLRSSIVLPPTLNSVTYSYLSSLVGDYLLRTSSPSAPLSLEAALEILPSTRYGLNLNPRFGSIDGFRPSGSGGELALFETAKVPLVHGWVVDPQDEETWDVVEERCGDYDTALERCVEADVIAGEGGQVEDGEEDEGRMMAAIQRRSEWSKEEEEKVRQGHLIRRFLTTSQTQLTYHGLFLLSTHLAPNSLSALFRNSHLSVIYRRASSPSNSRGPQLFTLVTDESFANEGEVVWESLEDVEGGASEFWDGELRRASPRGGDWVSRRRRRGSSSEQRVEEERQLTPAEEVEQYERRNQALPSNDFALAQQLQQEEDFLAHQQHSSSSVLPNRRAETGSQRLRRLQAAESAPAVLATGALSVGPEAVAGVPPREGRDGREKERANGRKEKEKGGKEKCVVS